MCTKKEDDISSTVFSDSERERETRTVSASKHQTLDTHSFLSENSDWDKLQMQRLLSFTRASICGYTRLLVITSTFCVGFLTSCLSVSFHAVTESAHLFFWLVSFESALDKQP